MKVLFLDSVHPVLEEMLEQAGYEVVKDYTVTPADVPARYPGVNGLVVRSRFKIDATFIEGLPQLRFIARAGAGMENIDLLAAEKAGVNCFHAPEGNRDAVGEHAVGMLLALFNNLVRADREVRQGKWQREANRGIELQGKTVGIIGFGNMGSAFARRLSGFGVRILAYDKFKKGFSDGLVIESSLQQLLDNSDVISLHVPLTEETRYMIDENFISSVGQPFVLINTARGKVVETAALVEGMKSGKVVGACLDVLEYEQVSFENLTAEEPEPLRYLKESDRVILSPHIAGWTFESHRKISEVLARKILLEFGSRD